MSQPVTHREWVRCPYCGAKTTGLYGENAECKGLDTKCTRGCGKEFELIIVAGKQVLPDKTKSP